MEELKLELHKSQMKIDNLSVIMEELKIKISVADEMIKFGDKNIEDLVNGREEEMLKLIENQKLLFLEESEARVKLIALMNSADMRMKIKNEISFLT